MTENLFDDPDDLIDWDEEDWYVEEVFEEINWEEGQILHGTKVG